MADCGSRASNKWTVDWVQQFNLFKNECSTRRSVSHLGHVNAKTALGKPADPEDDIGELYDGASGGAQTSSEIQKQTVAFQRKVHKKIENKINSKREEAILNTVRTTERQKASMQLAVTQNSGFKALEKENEIENLIEHEEHDREVKQFRQLARVIKKEKQKKNCLSKALKKREIDTQILEERREAKNEETEAKEELRLEIDLKRKQIKRKIENMRKKAKRRRAAMETQLQKVRAKITSKIMQANKNGDMGLCDSGKKNPAKRANYCDTNFIDDYLKNYDCKDGQNFCYMCCENEFGNNFIDKRNECYDMCDGRQPPLSSPIKKSTRAAAAAKAQAKAKNLGGWVWVKQPAKKPALNI